MSAANLISVLKKKYVAARFGLTVKKKYVAAQDSTILHPAACNNHSWAPNLGAQG